MLLLTGLALAGDPEVRWLADGRILVDGRLLMEPVRGSWQYLLYPTVRSYPSGSHRALDLDISPSGQVLLIDDAHVLLGLFDGRLAGSAPLPSLMSEAMDSAGVWLDDRRILLYQTGGAGETACAILDAQTRQWSDPVICPEGGFAHVYRMERGPGPWMAVYSAGEGNADVRIVRWTPTSGTRGAMDLTLSHEQRTAGTIELFFTDAGFRLLSPCSLLEAECTPGESWWYFDWLPSGDLRLFRDDVVPGAVPSPKDPSVFAWGEDGRVCIGDPSGERRCYPLPED